MLFDALAVQVNGPMAWEEQLSIDVVLTDSLVQYRLWLSNGALVYTTAKQSNDSDVTLTATTDQLPALAVSGPKPAALKKAGINITGDSAALERLGVLLEPGDPNFNIVTP